jgi:hypothetical protein
MTAESGAPTMLDRPRKLFTTRQKPFKRQRKASPGQSRRVEDPVV